MTAVSSPSACAEAAAILGPLARIDHPIGPLTTYRVGGRAAVFAELASEADLEAAAAAVSGTGIDVLVLGKGSNLLVADAGVAGLVLQLGGTFGELAIDSDAASATAGAALSYPVLARRTAAAGLTGLEWAVGVPGSVGGAVRMNAGGHGAETAATLLSARVVDLRGGEDRDVAASALDFSYRHSAIAADQLVVAATFSLEHGDREESERQISAIVRWRRANQPGGQNAGSVFTNPPGDSAGRLVEVAGLKGMRIGSAEVSPKHGNFIQADPGGSADDVLRLVDEVRRLVSERLGVLLEPELRIVGVRP